MSDENGKTNFDIVEAEFPFEFRKAGYVLREPTDEANLKHQRKQFANAKIHDGKVHADLNDAVEAPSILVGECVFKEGEDKPVGQKVVVKWPKRLVTMLYDKAREMAGLDTAESIDAQIEALQKSKEKLPDPKKQQPSTESD